jgi:hypothetical protein
MCPTHFFVKTNTRPELWEVSGPKVGLPTSVIFKKLPKDNCEKSPNLVTLPLHNRPQRLICEA